MRFLKASCGGTNIRNCEELWQNSDGSRDFIRRSCRFLNFETVPENVKEILVPELRAVG